MEEQPGEFVSIRVSRLKRLLDTGISTSCDDDADDDEEDDDPYDEVEELGICRLCCDADERSVTEDLSVCEDICGCMDSCELRMLD